MKPCHMSLRCLFLWHVLYSLVSFSSFMSTTMNRSNKEIPPFFKVLESHLYHLNPAGQCLNRRDNVFCGAGVGWLVWGELSNEVLLLSKEKDG